MYLLHKRRWRQQQETAFVDDDINIYIYICYDVLICIYIMKKDEDVEHQWLWWVKLDVVKDKE